MAQATTQQPVVIQSQWFRQGYARAVSGKAHMPTQPTEAAIVSVVQRCLDIARDDGEISQEQLAYECGLLTGYLVSTIG